MDQFNIAYQQALSGNRLTLGLMTPLARDVGAMADLDLERRAAALADHKGFAVLWARDVPLMVPQGSDVEAVPLDDPFIWLAALAAVTTTAALGTAAAVLPLRNSLHLAKSALSMDRITGGRFILGLGSGDREAEFTAFGLHAEKRGELFREQWDVVRAALSPIAAERQTLLNATDGFDLSTVPIARIPMLAVGSARQSLQWIAANADGWASYHRDEVRQQGRNGLWQSALKDRAAGAKKPFVQSLHLRLVEDAAAEAQPIELGICTGRTALVDYLSNMERAGVAHVLLHLARSTRPVLEVIEEIGSDVLPKLPAHQGLGLASRRRAVS